MIYEMRIYEHVEGRAEAVRKRFEDEVVPRLPKHGIELLGVFIAAEEKKLTYLTRYKDENARKAAWASFTADPEWKAAKAASETNGPLIARQIATVLAPVVAGLPLG
jgi:L-rhamnose mutarotase